MTDTLTRSETTPVIWTLTPGAYRLCVLCGYEVSIGEIWPDNKGGREHLICRGREHLICRGCRYRYARHLRKFDTSGNVGCRGEEPPSPPPSR